MAFPLQERHGHAGESTVKGHEDDEEMIGASLLWGEFERSETVQSGEVSGRPRQCL